MQSFSFFMIQYATQHLIMTYTIGIVAFIAQTSFLHLSCDSRLLKGDLFILASVQMFPHQSGCNYSGSKTHLHIT